MTRPGDPLILRSLRVPNRLWMSPMCQYSSEPTGPGAGSVTDWHVSHLEARAVGGVGLILTEATAVHPEGRVSPTDLGIWADAQVPGLARVVAAVERHGVVPALQLGHAGPKASTYQPWVDRRRRVEPADGGWIPWAPSPAPDGPVVRALSEAQVDAVPALFAAAAARARRAGFRAIEVHVAHGYLLHAFLSPLSNTRGDAYGRDRTKLVSDVIGAVREVWPQALPVLLRISGTDRLGGGLTVEDAVALTEKVVPMGVDLVDVSSGGLRPAAVDAFPGYQVPLAATVRRATGAVVSTVGLIEETGHVERILASGEADVVLAGRALLRDPHWARTVLREAGSPVAWPRQYAWALGPVG
ncbi:NADH:flavin oxidoreductase/NADH oxidase [Actinomycetospora sp. OC33-EN08]|uniref:NADH:flavin oxidoreductase/NADH oxidase n=1 Tax=Actinomycetospora aurantiaca TaxID=3129233 RepID=A0ABU8MM43_9PSEU